MATLTSNYQCIGYKKIRSNPNTYYYYLLLYAKTNANDITGVHTVSIRQVLACDANSSFYQWATTYSGKIDGKTVFSGNNKPDAPWETTNIEADGITFKRWTIISEGSTTIDCSDGKAHSVELSTSWKLDEWEVYSFLPSSKWETHTVTVTATLPAIPRATEIDSFACSTNYLDGTLTYKYTPQSASFYNRITLNILVNDERTELRTTNLGKKAASQQTATTTFTGAELSAIYAKLSKTATVTVQLRLGTYADADYSVKIGDTQKTSITLSLPVAIKPTVKLSVTPVNANKWIAARNIYVAGYSGATFSMTAEPGEGASISSTTITTPDNITHEAVKLNVELLKISGNLTFTAKAIDSRKRSTSVSKTITVHPYSVPTISAFKAERGTYNSGWTASDDGPDVKVSFTTALSLANNGNVYSAAFKLDGAAVTPNSGTTTGLASGASCTVYIKNVDAEISHSLKITVTDSVGNGTTVSITIPTKNITIEFNDSGKGLAMGKVSEREAFECAWPAYFNDSVYITNKITCPNPFSLRDFNINCNWADGAAHDMIARVKDGLTVRLGWSGDAEDGTEHETVLDFRSKQANFRGNVTAPRGRFTATTDSSGNEQNDVALRIGDANGQHIDMDTNEIQAKDSPTTPGALYLNLDGGEVHAGNFRIPEIQCGSVSITPSAASTPTSLPITFDQAFSGKPIVVVTPATAAPGTTVLGAGVNSITTTGCTLWVSRTNTTVTVLNWIAIY